MKLRSILDSPCGIRYMFSKLELQSSFSRTMLMDSVMLTESDSIRKTYADLSEIYNGFILNKDNRQIFNKLKIKLSHLKDIRVTLLRLRNGDTLDDIELFEIKSLAIISEEITELLKEISQSTISLKNLSQVIEILDPEKQEVHSFYVYDSYDKELAELRKSMRADAKYAHEHQYRAATIEARIREELAIKLKSFVEPLQDNLFALGRMDILLGKTKQIETMGLSIPQISTERTRYEDMFNPEVRDILKEKKVEYQKTNIDFDTQSPLLITGANMGGKTITLKTVALCQYLFQFGFGVPAKRAEIAPVESIYFSIGDGQNMQKGISSFAAEMIQINQIIDAVRSGKAILSLIDEPASSTNPMEGTALVTSLIKIMKRYRTATVITTHYNINVGDCRKIRVKGLQNGVLDYELIEDQGTEAPRESLQIARTLGIDNEWINVAENEIKRIK